MTFSPDGKIIACHSGYAIILWDVNTGQQLRILSKQMSGYGIHLVEFNPDGRTIASCGSGEVHLWDVKHRTTHQNNHKSLMMLSRYDKLKYQFIIADLPSSNASVCTHVYPFFRTIF